MKIADIRALTLIRPIRHDFLESAGRVNDRNRLAVHVLTDIGVVGSTLAKYSDGYQRDVSQMVDAVFKPLLLGEDLHDLERLWDRMFNAGKDLTSPWIHVLDLSRRIIKMWAISTVDIALWDALGKATATPVYKLLGGYRDKVPVIAVGGYYGKAKGDRDLVAEMICFQEVGLAGVKMKVGQVDVNEDVRRVRIVREAVGPDFIIACDASQAWTPDEAIKFAKLAGDLNLRSLEEPVRWHDQLQGLRRVRQASNIPVSAGRGEISRVGCRNLIAGEAVDILNVDATIAGGVTEWRKIAAMAAMFGVSMGHSGEPNIAIHLQASVPNGQYVEIFPGRDRNAVSHRLPVRYPPIKDGYMEVPCGPGFGIELASSSIAEYPEESLA